MGKVGQHKQSVAIWAMLSANVEPIQCAIENKRDGNQDPDLRREAVEYFKRTPTVHRFGVAQNRQPRGMRNKEIEINHQFTLVFDRK